MKKKHDVLNMIFSLCLVLFLFLPSTYVFAHSSLKSTAQFEVIDDTKGEDIPQIDGHEPLPPTASHPRYPSSQTTTMIKKGNTTVPSPFSSLSRRFAQTGEKTKPWLGLIGLEMVFMAIMLFILKKKKKQEDNETA